MWGLVLRIKRTKRATSIGAPVILKPSEWAPFSLSLFAKAVSKTSIPPGVIQVVHGKIQMRAHALSSSRNVSTS